MYAQPGRPAPPSKRARPRAPASRLRYPLVQRVPRQRDWGSHKQTKNYFLPFAPPRPAPPRPARPRSQKGIMGPPGGRKRAALMLGPDRAGLGCALRAEAAGVCGRDGPGPLRAFPRSPAGRFPEPRGGGLRVRRFRLCKPAARLVLPGPEDRGSDLYPCSSVPGARVWIPFGLPCTSY